MFYILYVALARCPCVTQNINMIKGRPNLKIWRGVWVSFFKIAIVSFLSVRYKSDGLYCRMARTPSSPTLFSTPSVWKYLSSKWIKRDVSRTKIYLDTSPFIHFDDKYFRTEGVPTKLNKGSAWWQSHEAGCAHTHRPHTTRNTLC